EKPFEYKYFIGKKAEGDEIVGSAYDVVQYASYHDLRIGLKYCSKEKPCGKVNYIEIYVRQSSEEGIAYLDDSTNLGERYIKITLLCVKITYVMFNALLYGTYNDTYEENSILNS
uniref:Uncharacterized protein n=1 Tax=Megaselia scalaris TaxID=36166 RepID=T1H5D1_MEGSC